MGRDIADGLAGEHLRMGFGLLNGERVIWPARREGDEIVLLEERGPPIPARRQQPQAMDEDDRSTA